MNIFLKYPNSTFVETGTYHGNGIKQAIEAGFKRIISIESKEEYYNECCKSFSNLIENKKVELILGRSDEQLGRIMATITEPVTFFFDAHPTDGEEYLPGATFPLQKEIEIICDHGIKIHTILIDDVRLFGCFKTSKDWIVDKVTQNNPKCSVSYDTYHPQFPNDLMVIK